MAFYAFIKDAKGYEHARRAAVSDADLMAQTLADDGQPLSKLASEQSAPEEDTNRNAA